jgi:hypothetical protein
MAVSRWLGRYRGSATTVAMAKESIAHCHRLLTTPERKAAIPAPADGASHNRAAPPRCAPTGSRPILTLSALDKSHNRRRQAVIAERMQSAPTMDPDHCQHIAGDRRANDAVSDVSNQSMVPPLITWPANQPTTAPITSQMRKFTGSICFSRSGAIAGCGRDDLRRPATSHRVRAGSSAREIGMSTPRCS